MLFPNLLRALVLAAGLFAAPVGGLSSGSSSKPPSAAYREARFLGLGAGLAFFAGAGAFAHEPAITAAPLLASAALVAGRSIPVPAPNPPLSLQAGDLVVRPVPGKGRGLFAARAISKGRFCFDYLGEPLTEEALLRRYPDGEAAYVLELNGPLGLRPTYVDAAEEVRSNVARFANHAPDPNMERRTQRFPTRVVRLFARRDIAASEELCWNYGDDYWRGREDQMVL